MARAFCFLIQRNFFVWLLAKVSISIVMCMTVERWYALARPSRYKILFTPRKMMFYVATLSSIVLIATIPALFQTFAETQRAQQFVLTSLSWEVLWVVKFSRSYIAQ